MLHIPSQDKVTVQILNHWQSFITLKLSYAGSRRVEHLSLRSQQNIVVTVEDSVLRTEMTGLESQEEDAPPRILFNKSMSWLGQIRPNHRDEAWPATLWKTFFSVSLGVPIPDITERSFAACGCRRFQIDTLGDHLGTCIGHFGAKKAHDWAVDQLADLFHTTHRVKTQQVVKNQGQYCGDIEFAGYLQNTVGTVPLVLDLLIAHERWGSNTDPTLNGHLHYPKDLD
jgi:hypothetical protein